MVDWCAFAPSCGVGLLVIQLHVSPPMASSVEPAGTASLIHTTSFVEAEFVEEPPVDVPSPGTEFVGVGTEFVGVGVGIETIGVDLPELSQFTRPP